MTYLQTERLLALDAALTETAWLWRPMPFKEARPQWCHDAPALAQACLALDDDAVDQLTRDGAAAWSFVSHWVPGPPDMPALCRVDAVEAPALKQLGPHIRCDIPGRKWEQIEAFARALGVFDIKGVEWCGGKGHLGRVVAAASGQAVHTLEHDAELCEAGRGLARKAGVAQEFETRDVLSLVGLEAYGRHGVMALHACGDLHRKLVELAEPDSSTRLHLSPCCYHLSALSEYHACLPAARLVLSREDRRLAVTDTATSSARELRLRDREMAWKLGYVCLREDVLGSAAYAPIKPIPKAWLGGSFESFCRALAARDGLPVVSVSQWDRYEQAGYRRQREVMRLSVVRLAFRRALELWLVFDLALRLEAKGYDVAVNTFCEPSVTPRNILISAKS